LESRKALVNYVQKNNTTYNERQPNYKERKPPERSFSIGWSITISWKKKLSGQEPKN